MLNLQINGRPVVMSKFFTAKDQEAVITAIPEGTKRVVFIDTPATEHLVATVEALMGDSIEVIVRDHHDAPNPSNKREQEIAAAATKIRGLLGESTIISDRETHPGCSTLIESAEFAKGDGTIIVADPDPDGLTATMKALGVAYRELDKDAAVLDGPRVGQNADSLSPTALLLVRAMSALPPFNPGIPDALENAKAALFEDFVTWVGSSDQEGAKEAEEALQERAEAYEAGVQEAERLITTVEEVSPGIIFVDVTEAGRFDLGTLATQMENFDGCKVTVQRKSQGPIAAKHGGVQVSLAVPKTIQNELNLQDMLEPGFESSPASGIISNTTFLLHVSEEIWSSQVLPALKLRFS